MGLFDDLASVAGAGYRGVRSGLAAISDPLVSLGLQPSFEESRQSQLRKRMAEWNSTPLRERPLLQDKWKAEDAQFSGLFKSLVPEPALETLGSVPLVGEEARRIVEGTTTPLSLGLIIGTAGLAGPEVAAGTVGYGTAGAFGLGLGGQALESQGINPRLKIPLPGAEKLGLPKETNLGPRAIGELIGGSFGGGKKLTDMELQIKSLRDAGYEVPPELEKNMLRSAAEVDDAALTRFDYADQMKQARRPEGLNPALVETSWDDWFKEQMRAPVGEGGLHWLPQPFRAVTDKATQGLALKYGSPNWFALNYFTQLENVSHSAGTLVRGLAQAERNAGVLAREGGGLTGAVKRFAIGEDLPIAQDPIAGIKESSTGAAPTLENIMKAPDTFDLNPQFRDAITFYKDSVGGLRGSAQQILENAGIAKAEIDRLLPAMPLEKGEVYFHHLPLDEDMRPLFSGRRSQVGAKQGFEYERAPLTENRRSVGSLAVSLKDYTEQITKIVADNVFWEPLLKKAGVSVESKLPQEFADKVAQLSQTQNWLKRAQLLTRDAKYGRSVKDVARRVRELSSEPDVPQEMKDALGRLTMADAATARGVERDLKALGATNRDDLNFAKYQKRLASRMTIRGQYGFLDMQKFPGLSQWAFEKNWAKQLNQAWSRLGEQPDGFWKAMSDYQSLLQAGQAGTSDLGQFGLQLMSMFNPATAHMIPAVFARMWSSGATERFLMGAADRFPSFDPRSFHELATLYGLRMGVEAAEPVALVGRSGGVTGTLARVLQNVPTNRAFTRAVNQGRLIMFENMVRLTERFKGSALSPEQYRAAARVAGTVTGDFNWTRAGISQGQRTAERAGLRFAPSWLRAQLQLVLTAMTPFAHGTEQNLARASLAGTVGTVAGIYAATAAALGQNPNFDPTDTGNFMTLKVGGQKVGPGGPILALMRTAGRMADLAHTAATADTEEARKAALNKLVDIRDSGNPLVKFWRGGAPTLTGLMYDILVQGRESYGGQKALGPEHIKNTGLAFLQSFEPFGVQALREEGPVSAGVQFFGGRAFPMSAPEKFLEAADSQAKEQGFENWAAMPKAAQADLLRHDADLAELKAKEDSYYERFPNKKTAAYNEIDKSRQAVEDMLLSSYHAVETGALTLPEFRQRYSDLTQQHAYLSNSLLDAQGSGEEQRDDETKQDYYARTYASIQPEQFDQDQDGTIDEGEWQAWREARSSFWQQHPEAVNFRTYITQEYPTRYWKSPEMADIARQRYQALDLYGQFLEIPKYRGLTQDDAVFIETVRKLKGRVAQELRYRAGAPIELSGRQSWGMALDMLSGQRLTGRQKELIGYAIALDKPRVRQALINPERGRFLSANPELATWYPSVLEDAGITTAEASAFGAPLGGTSAEDLVASVA